ncbi:LysR family transcriptional regulator [Lysobacteraceae bacterium NML120232]|nr:LysR family transcriptional regulator [Xanthomonadaceae bacterium NML120232]
MNLDWNDLQHFVTLVEQETLTAAAEALDVQHSTVSRRIAQLESALGVRLFDRIGKRYLLTEDGTRIHAQAQELAKDILTLQRLARGAGDRQARVVVSAPPLVLRELLPARQLAAFAELEPHIRLVLQGEARISDLHARQADIALRLVRPAQNDLAIRRLRSLRFGFYACPPYPQRPQADWRFLLIPADARQGRWARQIIGSDAPALECNDFLLIKQCLLEGMGVGLLPEFFVRPEDPLVPLAVHAATPEVLEEDLYLVMHEDVRRSPAVRAVADFLVQALLEDASPRS